MSGRAGRWRYALLLVLTTAGVLWGGWRWSENRRYRRTLERAQDAMDSRLYALAASELIELDTRNPGVDEVAFLLGKCERARGRPHAAVAAWAKVATGSTFAFHALEGRVQLELEQGRLTAAEDLIAKSISGPAVADPDPRILLGPIYCSEGRFGDAMRLLETLWHRQNQAGTGASEIAINQLRLYVQLRLAPTSDDVIGATLDRAGQIAPDDHRIWLWQAKLAIRKKSYEQAVRWINRCLERRPRDPAVWLARLECAMATNQLPEAQEALKHLFADEWDSARIAKLAAWFARTGGDGATEQCALERLVAVDPADFIAVDRLIELLLKIGQTERVAQESRQKDETVRVLARYQLLFNRNQPRRDAAEMGQLAARLGRRFEGVAFLTVAIAGAPDRADVRRDLAQLTQSAQTLPASGHMLDERLARELRDIRSQLESTCQQSNRK
jgi:Flp pilus assembly protein TadD